MSNCTKCRPPSNRFTAYSVIPTLTSYLSISAAYHIHFSPTIILLLFLTGAAALLSTEAPDLPANLLSASSWPHNHSAPSTLVPCEQFFACLSHISTSLDHFYANSCRHAMVGEGDIKTALLKWDKEVLFSWCYLTVQYPTLLQSFPLQGLKAIIWLRKSLGCSIWTEPSLAISATASPCGLWKELIFTCSHVHLLYTRFPRKMAEKWGEQQRMLSFHMAYLARTLG